MPKSAGTGPDPEGGSDGKVPVTIKREWCKACGICIEFCPKKVFESDAEGNPSIAHPEACSLCGICQQLCPDFAITVRREKRARKN